MAGSGLINIKQFINYRFVINELTGMFLYKKISCLQIISGIIGWHGFNNRTIKSVCWNLF